MSGYKIGLENSNLYIAVPQKYFEYPNEDASVMIVYEDRRIVVTPLEIIKRMTFDDKFNKNKSYTLCYVLWKDYEKKY